MDLYSFYTGVCFDAYKYFGAHYNNGSTTFRVFAPSAKCVALIGEFNDWNGQHMNKVEDGNIYEITVSNAKPGMMYKYAITGADGRTVDHCDPYGFGMELRPNSASIIRELNEYKFNDISWMRKRTDCKGGPLNIYEMHLGSWKKPSDAGDIWYNYEELADMLIPYLKENGYNYIEVLPLSEHPCDESWGYQNTGFFAPTSRYGTVSQLKSFVDKLHRSNIGIIMDFVPVHFAVDYYGLANFDGTALYEYPHSDVRHCEWGSCNFIHSRGETRSFLQSAANYWLEEFHFDGIRIDAIRNMIYWQGNEARGENLPSIEFLRNMNSGLKKRHPSAILAAEDSTSYGKVTAPVQYGGLGFDYKWDMGWMNDTLDYFRTGPAYRTKDYHKLTFSMHYYYTEKFMLPLSHDEVVHGKATIAQKMSGDYEDKFPQAKALYMYMYTHPGKKLNFMGNEFAQLREWDEKREQDWDVLKYPNHDDFHRYMQKLCHLYLETPALYMLDYDQRGFNWVDCHQEQTCQYLYERTDGKTTVLCMFNFSDKPQHYHLNGNYKSLKLMLATDYNAEESFKMYHGYTSITMPPFSGRIYLECR